MPQRRRSQRIAAKQKSSGTYAANAEELAKNAQDTAALYLCGGSNDKCKELQMPELVRKLVFDGGLYANSTVHEAARQVLQTIHKGRACIWSNDITYSVAARQFTTVLNLGRKGQKEVAFDKQLFANWIRDCDKGIMGVSLSLDLGPGAGHANMLIIDTKSKTVEHFEPHGDSMGSLSDAQNNQLHRDVEALMLDSLKLAGKQGYKYLKPSDVCPDFEIGSSYTNEFGKKVTAGKEGIQAFLNKNRAGSEFAGTCAIWSLWYLHVRLNSPAGSDPQDVLKRAMSQATNLVDANFPSGLDSICKNAKNDYNRWCTDKGTAPKGWDQQTWLRTKKAFDADCAPACDHAETMLKAGATLEDFIIRFTQQLISLLQIEIVTSYQRSCDGGYFYTYKSQQEGDSSRQASQEGCDPTESVDVVKAGDGRRLFQISAKGKRDISGDDVQNLPKNIPLPDSAEWVVYGRTSSGRNNCIFCQRAKDLLAETKVNHKYVNKLEYDADAFSSKIRPLYPADHGTVPVVFHNGKFVGGYTQLKDMIAGSKAAPSQPVSKPAAAATKPATPKPAATEPAAKEPPALKPAAPKPAATERPAPKPRQNVTRAPTEPQVIVNLKDKRLMMHGPYGVYWEAK